MGRGKQKPQRNVRRGRQQNEQEDDPLPSSAFDISLASSVEEPPAYPVEEAHYGHYQLSEGPSKYELYQTSVQSPKGDISYLQKFFLSYIGGRSPVHLREDFCGSALLWASSDSSRAFSGEQVALEKCDYNFWGDVDIICAFNYSCCCLHNRPDLVLYFKHVLDSLSAKGGIFAMDLYGGVSSEARLKLRRHFPDFTYIWEQEAFDVINRMTKISLHFQLKNNRMIRHAFTYHWRLWSLPEIKDSLKEAGFDSVHFWVRDMPNLEEREDNEDTWDEDSRYEEATVFYQQSAWNAYIVAIASRKEHP